MGLERSNNEISKITGFSKSSIDNIKQCRGKYKFLTEKYGLEPQYSKISDEEAIEIYNMGLEKPIYKIAKIYKRSEHTISDIRFCRGRYKFLIEKYGLQPQQKH